jgi:extradiol dioxygenase family protein
VRTTTDAFHLAIPTYDLDQAEHFYAAGLGCTRARRYDDRVTFNFFGDQLVCHLSTRPAPSGEELDLYPRHFGVTFHERSDFARIYELVKSRPLPLFRDLTERFSGLREVHETFVIRDPADNLIEFKHYSDPAMMY